MLTERLRAEHADAVRAFETANRAYFAASISDRGDAYFAEFDQRFREDLAAQEAGSAHFHVVVHGDAVLGRINLYVVGDGYADLGFRIARNAAGRGLATAAAREVCGRAAKDYGLRTVRASAADDNLGSRAVLRHLDFVPTGEPVTLGRRAGRRYLLTLPGPPTSER